MSRISTHAGATWRSFGREAGFPKTREPCVGLWLRKAIMPVGHVSPNAESTTHHGASERSGRTHRLLVLRYVQGLEPSEVWAQLGIGKSEYSREHSDGLDAVASLLWQKSAEADSTRAQLPTAAQIRRALHISATPALIPEMRREDVARAWLGCLDLPGRRLEPSSAFGLVSGLQLSTP